MFSHKVLFPDWQLIPLLISFSQLVSVLPSNAVYSAPWGVCCYVYGKAGVLPAACEESDTGSDSYAVISGSDYK